MRSRRWRRRAGGCGIRCGGRAGETLTRWRSPPPASRSRSKRRPKVTTGATSLGSASRRSGWPAAGEGGHAAVCPWRHVPRPCARRRARRQGRPRRLDRPVDACPPRCRADVFRHTCGVVQLFASTAPLARGPDIATTRSTASSMRTGSRGRVGRRGWWRSKGGVSRGFDWRLEASALRSRPEDSAAPPSPVGLLPQLVQGTMQRRSNAPLCAVAWAPLRGVGAQRRPGSRRSSDAAQRWRPTALREL